MVRFADRIEAADRLFINQHLPQVVQLRMDDGGRCSGFIVAKDTIFTAAHCTEGHTEINVHFDDGAKRRFKVVEEGIPGSGIDYAVLQGDTRKIEPLRVSADIPERFSSCFTVGYGGPDQHEPQQTAPCIINSVVMEFPAPALEIIGRVIPGDSGGVLIDNQGRAVGVIFAYVRIIPEAGVIAPFANIKEVLEKYKVKIE